MNAVTIKPLPASVPHASIPDAATRTSVMKLFEDIRHLQSQDERVAKVIAEILKNPFEQRKRNEYVLPFFNVDMGEDIYRRIVLSHIVQNASKRYDVAVTFFNAHSSDRMCVVWKNTTSTVASDGTIVNVPACDSSSHTPGVNTITTTMTGSDFIRIDNIATTCDVIVRIVEA